MAATSPLVRYSNAKVATSEEAKSFPWEFPAPVNPFWDTFDYTTARNFLINFTDTELTQLPINPDSTDPHPAKLQLLLHLLQDKLTREEASTSPPNTLFDKDYKRWYTLWQGIYELQSKLHLPEAEQIIRMLATRRPEGSDNISPLHILSDHLVRIRQYKEAEETERQVCAWMDAHPRLGRDSPQAINSRRVIVRALWGQGEGRRKEAEAMLREVEGIVEGMGEGRFGVYLEEERRLNREMRAGLGIM
jgi:hypothetical protein